MTTTAVADAPAGEKTGNAPLMSFRVRNLDAAVFANSAKGDTEQTFHTVTVRRRYQDQNGDWQTSNSFNRDDLPVLRVLIDRAFDFILHVEQEARKQR